MSWTELPRSRSEPRLRAPLGRTSKWRSRLELTKHNVNHKFCSLLDEKPTFIVLPRVLVGPVDEFLVDPCQEPDGRICQAVAQRLRLCRLLEEVSIPSLPEPGGSVHPRFLRGGVRSNQVFKYEPWRCREGRWRNAARRRSTMSN